jgi:Na+/proline symporter
MGVIAETRISYLDVGVLVGYLVAVLGLGVYQARKIRTTGDYYAGGRKFNKFYLMMHALGTASHADEPVSVIGGAYEKGLSGIWYTYMFLPLTPIFWLLAPFIRRLRIVTVADFFRIRYHPSLALMYTIMGVLKLSIGIGVVLKGTAVIFASLTNGAINENYAIIAMTVVFVTYGFAGGLRATVITETLQGPLIVIMSLLLVPYGFAQIGGFRGMHEALKPEMFSLTAAGFEFTPSWIISSSLTALIGWVAQPGIVAAVGSGKTELEGRVGYTYGTMIKRFCAMGWVFTGIIVAAMAAQQKLPQEMVAGLAKRRELAFGTAMHALLPAGLMGLMFAAIFSSQMATLSAHMVNSSALASRNLYKEWIRPAAADREVLWFGRICGLFLVAIGVTLAYQLGQVATALTMLLGFASIMGVLVWGGVLWPRANTAGAWAAVITLLVVWVFLGPVGMIIRTRLHINWEMHTRLWGLPIDLGLGLFGDEKRFDKLMLRALPPGIFALVIGSLLTRPLPRKQVADFFLLLRTPVGQEQRLIDAGVPIVYSGSTTANALELKYPRLVHWGGFVLAALICVVVIATLYLLANIGA